MSTPRLFSFEIRHLGLAFLNTVRWIVRRLGLRKHLKALNYGMLFLLLLVSLFCAFCLIKLGGADAWDPRPEQETLEEVVLLPNLEKHIEDLKAENQTREHHFFVGPSDSLKQIFIKAGIRDIAFLRFLQSHNVWEFLGVQPGQFIKLSVFGNGRLALAQLYLEGPHTPDNRTVSIERMGPNFVLTRSPYTFSSVEETVEGLWKGNITLTARQMGLPASIASQLADVWDAKNSPLRNLAKNIKLRLIFERKFADNIFVRHGKLLAVKIETPEPIEAFWFNDGNRLGNYFYKDGSATRQTFLRVPLEIQDISSVFAPLRRHPVTGVIRAHNGTDMRAPTGSRIFAASDGVITTINYEPRGYGRYLKVSHGSDIKTVYAHLSRFEKGIRIRQKVKKGDVIGYVGMTGLATGPHLHYELIIDGVQVNPKTADLPDQDHLSPYKKARFLAWIEPLQERFEQAIDPQKEDDSL